MLVRALKVRDYFLMAIIGTDIDTAALDQPGDEGCAYGRAAPDWQRCARFFEGARAREAGGTRRAFLCDDGPHDIMMEYRWPDSYAPLRKRLPFPQIGLRRP